MQSSIEAVSGNKQTEVSCSKWAKRFIIDVYNFIHHRSPPHTENGGNGLLGKVCGRGLVWVVLWDEVIYEQLRVQIF